MMSHIGISEANSWESEGAIETCGSLGMSPMKTSIKLSSQIFKKEAIKFPVGTELGMMRVHMFS